jgi:hypothetical protein
MSRSLGALCTDTPNSRVVCQNLGCAEDSDISNISGEASNSRLSKHRCFRAWRWRPQAGSKKGIPINLLLDQLDAAMKRAAAATDARKVIESVFIEHLPSLDLAETGLCQVLEDLKASSLVRGTPSSPQAGRQGRSAPPLCNSTLLVKTLCACGKEI